MVPHSGAPWVCPDVAPSIETVVIGENLMSGLTGWILWFVLVFGGLALIFAIDRAAGRHR
jgi:hypothetical protein